jgi:hypothetical protein
MRSALVDLYRHKFKWTDSENPIISTELSSYLDGFKKKRARNPTFNAIRSSPFSYKDLVKTNAAIMDTNTYESELFLIVSSLSFYLWLRIDEALTLTYQAITLNDSNALTSMETYHTIRVILRKTDKTDIHGQVYSQINNRYIIFIEPQTSLQLAYLQHLIAG